jgi:hypothetical protein
MIHNQNPSSRQPLEKVTHPIMELNDVLEGFGSGDPLYELVAR